MPIRVRLALWFSAIFALNLLVLGLLLYMFMDRHLNGMVDDAIVARVEHLVADFQSSNASRSSADALVIPQLDAFQAPEVYVQVYSATGPTLARSSNLEGQSLGFSTGQLKQGEISLSMNGTALKAIVAPVNVAGTTVAWVQVAASYRQRDLVLGWLRWVLLGGGLGAVAAVAAISGGLAGRALRPVRDMMETAQAIALSRGFSRRLPQRNPSDELGQLARTFNEMLASLEEAYAAQQRFTADASHELRAPLTAIRGNLDLLDRAKGLPEEERAAMLRHVRQDMESLSRLVNDLLTLARADAGQSFPLQPVEVDTVLLDVHRQAKALARNVTLKLGALEPATVHGDADRLKELLLVLVDNALRYTPEGGVVTLWLRRQSPWVLVGVEDTGIGIDKDDLPHIFERFWRADKARSTDSGGTGLGLSIAKWIVERHNGEILVDSTPGKGSRFTVRLPSA